MQNEPHRRPTETPTRPQPVRPDTHRQTATRHPPIRKTRKPLRQHTPPPAPGPNQSRKQRNRRARAPEVDGNQTRKHDPTLHGWLQSRQRNKSMRVALHVNHQSKTRHSIRGILQHRRRGRHRGWRNPRHPRRPTQPGGNDKDEQVQVDLPMRRQPQRVKGPLRRTDKQ